MPDFFLDEPLKSLKEVHFPGAGKKQESPTPGG